MAEETEFAVVDLGHLTWPTSLQLPNRFRLFVASDTTHTATAAMADFAKAALSSGMVYFCAWGPDCEKFHDIVDEVKERGSVTPTPEDAVMTTWHEDETLEDALDFFATCAVPLGGYAAGSRYRLVICVGNPDWASTAARFLKAAKFLI